MSYVKELLAALVRCQSVTPHDADCQIFMMQYLSELGFECQPFNNPPVSNFFARIGNTSPLLIFAGHTDVVPVGDRIQWNTEPFDLHEKDGYLYGRGTADMKGSLACMLIAASRFVNEHQNFNGSLGFLITSGEEGDDFDLGTPYIMEQLERQGILPQFCIVGEPSSTNIVGDVIRIGRRGSLSGKLTLKGTQGHVAYPHLAENPIHLILPALNELVSTQWDTGNACFPATSLQVTHVKAGGKAGNIIPGEFKVDFNFRYCSEQTAALLQQSVTECFNRYELNQEIEWRLNGVPFLTSGGKLISETIDVIKHHIHQEPELSTGGGTSDGRFIAPYGVELIELGPVNATIHQVNECVALADLNMLSELYYEICVRLLTSA